MKKILTILVVSGLIALIFYARYTNTIQTSKEEVANLPDRAITEEQFLAEWEQSAEAKEYREEQQTMREQQELLQQELDDMNKEEEKEKEEGTAIEVIEDDTQNNPPAPQPTTLAQGSFNKIDAIHFANGGVDIKAEGDDVYIIISDEFKTSRGPDLYVLLSKNSGNEYIEADALNVGPLTAFEGKQIYKVSREEFDAHNSSVKIRCRAFDVMFSVADLRG